MIDLVREIRRRAPSEEKPSIKLANPDLFSDLIPWYQSTKDAVVRALIKELFYHAGETWSEALDKVLEHDEVATNLKNVKYATKVYRGQTQLVEIAPKEASTSTSTQKMYRGQVIR